MRNNRHKPIHFLFSIPELAEHKGLIRAEDLAPFALHRQFLPVLAECGILSRLSRGVYALPGTVHDPIALVAKRVPRGVICLLSALYFHGLASKPDQVWIAIGLKDRVPSLAFPSLRAVRLSGSARVEGVECFTVGGVPVRVYGVAKTVADCLKFRNKIGLSIALAALTKSLENGRCSLEQLRHFAGLCRVGGVLERLISRRAAPELVRALKSRPTSSE
jgi:predicted transcriptional regulator of viral defense system